MPRYPDTVFAEGLSFPTGECFKCTDICNCTVCCKKRGEEYISARGPPRGKPRLVEAPTLIVREKRVSKKKKTEEESSRAPRARPTTSLCIASGEIEKIGPIYRMDGARMRVTFVDPEDTSDEHIDDADVEMEEFTPKRIFIGKIRRSSGFKPRTKGVFIEPDDDPARLEAARQKLAVKGKKLIRYAGKPLVIQPPQPVYYGPADESDSELDGEWEEEEPDEDGGIALPDDFGLVFSSPLTSLPDTDIGGNRGTSMLWFLGVLKGTD